MAVRLLLKKYKKAIRFIYKKYANSGYGRKADTFAAFQVNKMKINITDLWTIRRDYLSKMVSKEELTALIRLVNTVILHNKQETRALEFEGFEHFFMQVAVFSYSKPPNDLRHLPPVHLIQMLINHFRETLAKKGGNTTFFDNPDTTTFGDSEVNDAINERLR